MDAPSGGGLSPLRDIVASALELSPESRAEFVQRRTATDPDLQREALRLLASIETEAGELNSPVANEAEQFVSEALGLPVSPEGVEGMRVGPYQLLEKIGEGGMGSVYLGERADGQFERKVAIKFVRDVARSPSALERFRIEEQILAGLVHPGIARMYDGGVSDTGVPYFAMEYVEGVRITDYCTREKLTVDQRLQLFLKVCDAVEYAQRNLVVHRDLKPSNILVTGDGRVKLLDFGIAKVIDPGDKDATQTQTQVLTPVYAAPEQLSSGRVTTATDVYSLGVVLFEMLTGQLPYERTDSYAAVLRAMNFESPRIPSTVVATSQHLHARFPADTASVRRVSRRLKRDLDAIILKALRKDPAKRYLTAESLGDDVRRSLENLPVEAKRGERWYRMGRFTRRHRVALLATVILGVLLAGFVWRLSVERDKAAREARLAASVTTFLEDLLTSGGQPISSRYERSDWFGDGPRDSITVRELLDRGLKKVYSDLADNQDLQEQMLFLLGGIYYSLGRLQKADSVNGELFGRQLMRHGISSERSIEVGLLLATVRHHQSRYAEADSLLDLITPQVQKVRVSEDLRIRLLVANAETKLARGIVDASIKYAEEAEKLARQGEEVDEEMVAYVYYALSEAYASAGRLNESLAASRKQVEVLEGTSLKGPLALAYRGLAGIMRVAGLYEEADSVLSVALPLLRQQFGDSSLHVYQGMQLLAQIRFYQDRLDEVLVLCRDQIGLINVLFDHPKGRALQTSRVYNLVASAHTRGGDLDSAIHYTTLTGELMLQVYPPGHPNLALNRMNLGVTLWAKGDLEEARLHLRQGLELLDNAGATPHPIDYINAGGIERLRGNAVAAESLLVAAAALNAAKAPSLTAYAYGRLAWTLLDQDRIQEADSAATKAVGAASMIEYGSLGARRDAYTAAAMVRYRQARYEESIEFSQIGEDIYRREAPGNPSIGELQSIRATALLAAADAEGAEAVLSEALDTMLLTRDERHYLASWTRCLLGGSLLAQEQYTEAEDYIIDGCSAMVATLSPKTTEVRVCRELIEELYSSAGRRIPQSVKAALEDQ